MQQELQKIQQEVSAYRDECKALEADSRLHDTVSIKQSLDSETAALRQTLQSLHQAAVAEDEALMGFRERVMVLLRSTESAIRLYQRSKLWRELSAAAGQLPGGAAGGAGGAGAGGGGGSQLLASQAVADQISQPVQLPNPYLGLAVRGFSEALEQYHRCISELERVMTAAGGAGGGLMGGGGAGGGAGDDAAAVAALPTLVSHMHDYFVHVAARLERLHGEVGRAREAYLAARRARGDFGDPFADARPLHHMSKSGVNPKSAHPGGGANNGGGTFYSFGGPATAAGNGAGGLGGMGGLGGAAGAGGAPGTPGAAGPGVGGGAGASGGGLFGMSPGPLGGGGASPFGAAGVGVGAFGTPLLGAASAQQPQQQRVSAGRAGSSSNKKR
ncbi:hypothetical protein HYH02_012798 [Chlamydomonas schloesseri]|uniref:Uncharacterized protein n=1 Tax=Chlamydomonas schloesseri TaxID=2026947 RepID=A0A835T5Z5_9CHLO|nr:hypothetical protein HYH02_012798 [Chlamydomonas schloesseri]|eukprot:KAG2433095.1 hypothetical protein HYH02_012798 [Chlamydomonas schloesseri]